MGLGPVDLILMANEEAMAIFIVDLQDKIR